MIKRLALISVVVIFLAACITLYLRRSSSLRPMNTQAIRVYLKLSDDASGSAAERDRLFDFDERLEARFPSKQPFEYDGHEIGQGYFTMYFYGPGADAILTAVRPLLSEFGIPVGSYLIRRYGDVGAPEERLAL